MRSALLGLVVLLASLAHSQVTAPPKPPAPPVVAAPAPELGVGQAGGLDDRCQAGLSGAYNMDDKGFKANNAKQSQALFDATTCIGYITGWSQTIDGAFIGEANRLWYVEISEGFNTTTEADGLHEYLKANPDARVVPSSLILLNVAVDKKMATVSPVEIKEGPGGQPQREDNPAPPTLKSKA